MNRLSLIETFITNNAFDSCVINYVTDDSRDVKKNTLFVARQGSGSHGIEHIDDAIKNGASCVISSQKIKKKIDIPICYMDNLEDCIVEILFKFYELSPEKFFLHGVTGTNGKTTTAYMAHNIMRQLKKPSMYVGTIGALINDEHILTQGNTTPGIFELFKILNQSNRQEITYVFVEISSHALVQKRLCNLPFHQSIILNIQSDHLDYHLSNENYINAKLSIINLNNINPTLIYIDKFKNLNFEFSKKQNDLLRQSKFISSIDSKAEFYYSLDFNSHGYSKIDFQFPGLDLTLKISTLLKFNIENYISAIALIFKHLSLSDFKKIDSQPLRLPEGRGELLKLNSGKVLIDFAHDHQSMQNILSALAVSYKEIVLVFGCGGDRDKSKRPKMMRVAQSIAQKIIFTSDNNRFEEFALIAADALKGNELKNTTIIENRKEAITEALKYLNEDNILVILGKGHETHMETLGKKIIFNDKDCVLKISNNETY